MGLFEQIKEEVRAQDAAKVLADIGVERLGADDRYWRSLSYAFHLHDPDKPEPLVFPLVLNPQSIKKTHPFAAELTPTQEAGVIAEENGVVLSDLVISGHTGLRPRVNDGARSIPIPLSGQAHFLWLQDSCFLRYSELKQDPKKAAATYMTWHNYKDGEHWVCVPRSLSLDRNVSRNFYYQYSIQLALIAEIKNDPTPIKEDSGLLRAMKDAVRQIGQALEKVESYMADLENIETEISRYTTGVLADLTTAVGAISLFTTGALSAIRYPQRALLALATNVDTVAKIADPNVVLSLPYDYAAAWLEISDGLLRIAAYPDKFSEAFDAARERFLLLTRGPANASTDDLDAAAASTLTQPQQLENSGLRPGDAQRVRAGIYSLPVDLPHYQGFRETPVLFGDSLPAIAARELGDARRWMDLALANALKAPYISEEGLPGTIRPGAPILIPTTDAPQAVDAVRSAGDPDTGVSQLDALFGRDFKLEAQPDGTYDFVVDPSTYTDLVTVSGIDNIEQAVTTILSTSKGSYLLHREVGIDRIVGRPGTVERVIEARSRVVEAVQRDPRVARVKNASFRLVEDTLEIGLEVDTADSTPIRVIGRVIS